MVQLGKRVGAGAATLCILCSVILSVLTVQFASFFLGEGPPLIWFVPAVLVTAYFAGLIPGLIATVLSALVVSFNFLRPVGSFWIESKNDLYRLIVFILIGIAISVLMESLHRAHERVKRLLQEAEAAKNEATAAKTEADAAKMEADAAKTEADAAKMEAEAANKSKSAFLAAMSHEIRTPLGVIIGCADLLRSRNLEDVSREYAHVIQRNGQVLLRLINDILDLAKVESGKFEIVRKRFLLAPLLNELISQFQIKSREKGIETRLSIEGLVPESITSDEGRFRQILTNLLGNAIKFTEQGSVRLSVRLLASPDLNKSTNRLEIAITDSGIGIELDQQRRIFEPFTQAADYINRKFGGTGLGLALSCRIAQSLGGELWLDSSALGKGSRFVATIDVGELTSVKMIDGHCVKEYSKGAAIGCRLKGGGQLAGLSILVVEDYLDNQLLIKAILEHHGASVDLASNGQEGVDMALDSNYDIVLMDIQMPILNGYLAVNRLRLAGYDRPIIALTAEAMSGEMDRCRTAGFDDYLSKPIDRYELVRMVEAIVSRRVSLGTAKITPLYSSIRGDAAFGYLVERFVRGLTARPSEFRSMLAEGKWREITELSHQLMGAGGGYGFQEISILTTKMEREAKDVAPRVQTLQSFIDELEILINRIHGGASPNLPI